MAAINPSTSKLWLRVVTRCSILLRNRPRWCLFLFFFFPPCFFLFLLFFSRFDSCVRCLKRILSLIIISWRILKKKKECEDYAFWLRIDWWIVNCLNRRYENLWFTGILIFNKQGFRNWIDMRNNRL